LHFDWLVWSLSMSSRSSAGFTLVEVLVALALLVVVSVGVVWLLAMALGAVRAAHDRTMAVSLATGKLEQLRSLEWRFEVDAGGVLIPRTDLSSNLSLEPIAGGGPGLTESPTGTLDGSMPPYVDYLDRHGRWVGSGTSPPATAVYIRRWAVHRLPGDPDRTVALQVLVATVRRERSRPAAEPHAWNGEDVLLTTMMTRRVR
jgi:prepilin-type N-terminal cleavage/methylation domain-containing protein